MPQELQVLRCYSCEAFQVHIVKKSPKWECKICGEKQSIKKVYGRGSGKDCRLYVQELNQKRLESNQETLASEAEIENSTLENHICTSIEYNDVKPNRWAEFLPLPATISSDVEEENKNFPNYTFERPIKKRKHTPLDKKCSKTNGESLMNEINDEESSSLTPTSNKKWSNCTTPSAVQENKGIFDNLLPKPLTNQKFLELKESDQKGHIKEKTDGYLFSSATANGTSVSDKSSRWAKLVSTTGASSDEELENHYLPHNTLEIPLKNRKCCEDLISKTSGNAHQIVDTGRNQVYHTQECKPEVSHFKSSSSKWNEFKDEDKFEHKEMLTNLSLSCHKPSLSEGSLKQEKVSDLFKDEENNLDSIFTF